MHTPNGLLQPMAENEHHAEIALYATMLFPYLMLSRAKNSNDGSVNKTITRRLEMSRQGQID